MTNAGMFEEIKKDKHIERLKKKIRKLQKDKDSDYQLYQIEIDQLKSEIHRLTTLETEHKKINGELNLEIERLKKDNTLLKEGNERLGIYRN